MGNFLFSMKMLKKEYKKSMVYTLTLTLTIAVTFLFFNIIDNTYLTSNEQVTTQWFYTQMPFSTMLSFLIIVFCAFMIIFANNFYISRKTKEIAIMTMSGSSFMKITFYLIYQNLVMTLIAYVLGIAIGFVLSIGVNQIIYYYMHYTAPFFYVPISAITDTIVCIVSILIGQIVYISGFVYRKDIQYLLSEEKRNTFDDVRILKIPKFSYIFFYIFGIVALFMDYSPISAIVPCIIGACGVGGMIKYNFPGFFHWLKQKKFLAHKTILISLSNLYYSLRRSCVLIGLYTVSSCIMIEIMIMQKDSPREFITSFIGFIVVITLLLASIIYKYIMEATTRKTSYYNLYKIGYSYKQIAMIVKQEVMMFYVLLILFPMIYLSVSLIQIYMHQGITLGFMMMILTVEIMFSLVAGIVTYISYKKNVLQVLKEGVRYE